jgi:hypothetical protein
MAYWLLLGSMIVVATGMLALILTDSQKVRDEKPAYRKAAVAMWLRILMVGWVMFVLAPFAVPGGFDGEWAWIASQPTALRVAMWVLLLPWMLAVGAWQLDMPAVLRIAVMFGIAALTFYLGSQLIGPKVERVGKSK